MEKTDILAGPIVRRVEPRCAVIWLVTRIDVAVDVVLFRLDGAQLQPLQTHRVDQAPVRIGKGCYVHLLRVESPLGMPLDTLLFYDLKFEVAGERYDLERLGLVSDSADQQDALNLQGLPLPSFFLPSRLENYLHGSCFKPHGQGNEALSRGEQVLQQWAEDLSLRPACLFLSGDQIYADDVDDGVFESVQWFITNHLKSAEANASWLAEFGSHMTAGRRDKLFEKQTFVGFRQGVRQYDVRKTFTSGAAKNHLVTFSEYFSLYMLVWNPANWPRHSEHYTRLGIDGYAIRRLFANTATYMVFDDHDVTDDWNLCRSWTQNVQGDRLCRRVVANGLAAFALCQGWGNQPERVDPIIAPIQQYLDQLDDPSDTASENFEQTLWNFRGWSFAVPTTPAIVALDTRMSRRQYEKHSGLLSEAGFQDIHDLWRRAGQPEEIILISAPPVLGQEFIESIQNLARKIGLGTAADVEYWRCDKSAFNRLLQMLCKDMRLKRCIVLSGDVHYSYTVRSEVRVDDHRMVLQQLTCSALRNYSPWMSRLFPQADPANIPATIPRAALKGFHLNQKGKKAARTDGSFGVIRTLDVGGRVRSTVEPITCNQDVVVVTHNAIALIQDDSHVNRVKHHVLADVKSGHVHTYEVAW